MSVYAANFTLDKGTDFETELTLTEYDGSPLNLVGYTGSAKIRKHPTSPKYKSFTITFVNRAEGRVKISLSSTQTGELDAGRNCYDFLITDGSGKVRKIIEGNIIVYETAALGLLDSNNLDGLGNIDTTNVQDGYILMYDQQQQKYVFVNPDDILSKSVEDDSIPQEFVDKLDQELDNKISIDAGEFS